MPTAPATPPRSGLVAALLILLTLAYYSWTAVCSLDEFPRLRPPGFPETDHFNHLSHGFLKGHLHLDVEVPPGLAAAANPYDPAGRPGVPVLHDASYFRGRYYIYFGPVPVVTVFLPFRVLTGRDLPLPWAVWFFCSAGFVVLAGLLRFLLRTHYPAAGRTEVAAALVALGFGTMLPALLRRPHIWELSLAAGFCFFAVALACLVRALHAARPERWALAGGLALGLATGSRPTYLVGCLLFVVPLLRRREGSRYGWGALAAAAAASGAVVAALLAYNHARFGDPLEFGQRYQLSAIVEGDARHFSLSYVPFNLHVYFLSALRWTATFPFHHGVAVPPIPPGHGGYEHAFGLLANLPFTWFSLAGLAAAGGFLRRPAAPALRSALTVIAGAAFLLTAVLAAYFGNCIRYLADFAPWITLLAILGFLEVHTALRGPAGRRVLAISGLVLAVGGGLATAAGVAGIYSLPDRLPDAYKPVARLLNQPLHWLRTRHAPGRQPIELTFDLPARRPRQAEPLVRVIRPNGVAATVSIHYLDGDQVRFGYQEAGLPGPVFSPAFPAPAGPVHTLRLALGGSYAEFDGFRARLRGQFNGRVAWNLPAVGFEALSGRLTPVEPADFSGTLRTVHDIGETVFEKPVLAGARIRFTPAAGMQGRSFPLVTSGRTRAGDLLFLRLTPGGRAVFGYDHWGDPLLTSAEVDLPAGQPAVIEFWPPAVAGEIVVRVNGAEVWRREAAAFPTTNQTFYLAANPIGGTTCEPVFADGIIEATQLPAPARLF